VVLIRATRRHLPENDNHHSHRRGNLKSYILDVLYFKQFSDIHTVNTKIDKNVYQHLVLSMKFAVNGSLLMITSTDKSCKKEINHHY
jgi:hypothetical protein